MLNVRTYIEFVLDLGTSKVKVRLVVEELVEIGFTRSNIGSVPCITAIHRFLGVKTSIKENILYNLMHFWELNEVQSPYVVGLNKRNDFCEN